MPRIRLTGAWHTQPLGAKVPEITVLFWVLKLLTTGTGEAISDFLGAVSIPLAAALGSFGLWFAMRLQLRAVRYRAPIYWSAVMMVAVFGTMAADGVHRGAGAPYALSTALYAVIVAGVFFQWHRSEGTLSIHSIHTRRRELYYWAAVLATFALGTAAGDLSAISLHLGYLDSALLFAALIALPALGYWRLKLNPILCFWVAYVLTRPLGASLADWFAKSHARSGLGLGDGTVSAIALVVFAALVAYVAARKRDIQAPMNDGAHPRLGHLHVGPLLEGASLESSLPDS
ncbi:MAG TPA: hypothetical protein VID48_14635 [Solirubrobacteraceae bacterium]|jgi:uncharacterized membrane-anchored protein